MYLSDIKIEGYRLFKDQNKRMNENKETFE